MNNVDNRAPPDPVAAPRTAVRNVTLGAEDAGQRVDKVLARLLPAVPRSHLFRMLRKGEVRLNGKRVKGEARTAAGDVLRVPPYRETPAADPDAPRPVPRRLIEQVEQAVIHEDERLLVLDKPSGIAVHGGSGIGFGVIEALRASRPEETLELVHRLDRDTSGCLLVARKRSTLRTLHALLREDAFDKRYLVLVRGKWELGAKRIDAPLRTDLRVGGERTVKVDPHGKPAASEFRVVQFYGRLATLLEVRLLTGRTHQIRVHAAHAGHPVAGDPKYGDAAFNEQMQELGLGRLFLHSTSISYQDPDRRVEVSVNAPLPDELKAFLDRLASAAASRKAKLRAATGPRRGARRPAR
jgi:23S rRNA pseudouridine955/2504/2580 synthase